MDGRMGRRWKGGGVEEGSFLSQKGLDLLIHSGIPTYFFYYLKIEARRIIPSRAVRAINQSNLFCTDNQI